jgi:twitching motility protein PilT
VITPVAPVAPAAPAAPVAPAPVTPPAAAPAASSPSVKVAVDGPPIDRLFRLMVESKASDLHLSSGMPPLVRKDGKILPLEPDAQPITPAEMIALLDPITPQANLDEFARRNDTDFAYEIKGLGRFRANVFLDRKGRGAVFRVIPAKILSAEDLGLSPHILKLCKLNKGLVLVTGPTGSGKSTTLCAMIDYINRTRTDHIITIEDPIEFVHENKGCLINQREVGTHTEGFKTALRAAMREDPDIMLVGELRDLETVAIAIETAETGHLVFGTLHTTTAASTVDRVIDQFPTEQQAQIRIMLSESLKGVIAQNLCRKIGGGRVAALEVLLINSAISNLIREAKTFQIPSMMQVGRAQGMVALNDALMELVTKKLVEPEEAYLKSVDKAAFEGLLKRANIDTKFVSAVAQ